jgi:hypothetical protein
MYSQIDGCLVRYRRKLRPVLQDEIVVGNISKGLHYQDQNFHCSKTKTKVKTRIASVDVNASVRVIADVFSLAERKCMRVLRLKAVERIHKMVLGSIEDIATSIWR